MSLLRQYRLEAARDRVLDAMSLRRPQTESLTAFHQILLALRRDVRDLSREELLAGWQEQQPGWRFGSDFPHMNFVLATGVGKTRLMGSLIAYLFLAGQASNFALLAPRAAILRKLVSEAQPDAEKYLFVDPGLLPPPRVWHSSNLEAFRPRPEDADPLEYGPDLFIFSPQALAGDDRRVARASEFAEGSLLDYLTDQEDLVVLADEAHHLGRVAENDSLAWTDALRALRPRLQLGMTATPREEAGANVLFEYGLKQALKERLYTKDVRVIVRERSDGDRMTDVEWDHLTLNFALDRLARKESAMATYQGTRAFPPIRPVLLVAAESTEHADEIAKWLTEHRDLDPTEVLVTHSRRAKTEDELRRLIEIERPESSVRIVVNVYELTEGWDVTNVYVIAPLRAMGTFQGAVQTMGRGLRLPAGRRVDDEELDVLDVLCFGRESLDAVLENAVRDYGDPESEASPVEITSDDDEDLNTPPATKEIEIKPASAVTVRIPRIRRVPEEPDLDFDMKSLRSVAEKSATELQLATLSVAGSADAVSYDFDVAVRLATGRVFAGLRYLSEPLNGDAVSRLVTNFLEAAGGSRDEPVRLDWVQVAALVADQIDRRYRRKSARFEALSDDIELSLGGFTWYVPENWKRSTRVDSIREWSPAKHKRMPITGWQKATAKAVPFDTEPEFVVAKVLDRSQAVRWWSRNDPPRLVIPTPIGGHEPDFVFQRNEETLVLEVKRADLWEAPDSDARVKGRAAVGWCNAISAAAAGEEWKYLVVLDVDAPRAETVDDFDGLSVAETLTEADGAPG